MDDGSRRQRRNIEISLEEAPDASVSFAVWKPWRKKLVFVAVVVLCIMAIVVRVIALDSDAYARLSWSSALLTDEGFYIHNARNLVLYGHARTDDFNNMLIMPLLHLIQVGVFRIWGVGAIQARLISVVLSLISLPLYFLALRGMLGNRVAAVGMLFLGLDHTAFLYNRLALMDTPALALLTAAFYAFSRAAPRVGIGVDGELAGGAASKQEKTWAFLCGALLGLTFATRGLTALVVPIFAASLWHAHEKDTSIIRIVRTLWFFFGLLIVLFVYYVAWYHPNETEIVRVNHYYVGELLTPGSLSHLKRNIIRGLFDYQRGMFPYLFRHSPVQFCLSLVGIVWTAARVGKRRIPGNDSVDNEPTRGMKRPARVALGLAAGWMTILLMFFSCVNYAPSRYYVLFYPAMAALAAGTLSRVTSMALEIAERRVHSAILSSLLICLGAQAARSRLDLIRPGDLHALFWALAIALFCGGLMRRRHSFAPAQPGAPPRTAAPELWVAAIAAWVVVNGYWTGDWLLHLTYRQKRADQWLETHLPPNSVLFGAVAPSLCLNNKFQAINVIQDLCNDSHPLEKFGPNRYVLILDGTWREVWWAKNYPEVVAPQNRVHVFPGLLRPFFYIGVYSVDGRKPVGSSDDVPDGKRPDGQF